MTRSVARSLCDNWASCFELHCNLAIAVVAIPLSLATVVHHSRAWQWDIFTNCQFNVITFVYDFYGAPRIHSADYAVARCLSVRLSVTRRYWSKRLYICSKFFSPSGSPTILVFSYQKGWKYSDGNPPNRGSECNGYATRSLAVTEIPRDASRHWIFC